MLALSATRVACKSGVLEEFACEANRWASRTERELLAKGYAKVPTE